jgi:hypothetical protein
MWLRLMWEWCRRDHCETVRVVMGQHWGCAVTHPRDGAWPRPHGCTGAVSGAHGLFKFLRTQWTKAELLLGIVVLEGLALVFLLVCLGPHVSGMLTVLQSDNAGMVFALLKEH